MGPYREMEPPADDVSTGAGAEDRGLYWLALVVGLIPCLAALISGGSWGAQPTLGLMMSVLSAGMLLRRAS